MDHHEQIACELRGIRETFQLGFAWFKSTAGLATKSDLAQLGHKIMSAISDFAAKQKAFNERLDNAVSSVSTSVTGLQGDIQSLNDKITALQNSSGTVTPEDQALIDQLEAQGGAIADKLEAASSALTALDELTPPTPPTA